MTIIFACGFTLSLTGQTLSRDYRESDSSNALRNEQLTAPAKR